MKKLSEKPLTEVQLKIINEVVIGTETIKDICKKYGVGKTTYYEWKKKQPAFNKALEEMLDLKKNISKQNAKSSAEKYIGWLEDIAKGSKNDNARVAALKELNEIAELKVVVDNNNDKDESKVKNKLMEMIKGKNE